MKRRTRHALILLVVPILPVFALAGWIVGATRMPLRLHDRVVARKARATYRSEAPSNTKLMPSDL